MKKLHIGGNTHCEIERLMSTRLLIQANSGGGKSWLIRRLLEQSHGRVQHLVIDPEGEFSTLREKFDYVLAARQGGDTIADPRSAKLLAERLLELGVSAVLDIYELKPHERVKFVRLFLDALVDAPKQLWHPVMVVLDEAHVYCPEKGDAESADAVKGLCTRGRKRGFCAVLATQRLSKLHKDAAAECNNKLIGRTSLDIDMKRAADELGFRTKEDMLHLRDLKDGEFFAFGPAICQQVERVIVGPVVTTHPKAGSHLAAVVPPPTAKVLAVLSKLSDLPAEAEAREKTEADLRKEITALKLKLTMAQKAQPPAPEPLPAKEVQVVRDEDIQLIDYVMFAANEAHQTLKKIEVFLTEKWPDLRAIRDRLQAIKSPSPTIDTSAKLRIQPPSPRTTFQRLVTPKEVNGDLKINSAQQRILDALAWFESIGTTQPTNLQVGAVALMDATGGHFSNLVGPLSTNGLITRGNGLISLTEDGRKYAQVPDNMATMGQYHDMLRERVRRARSAGGKTVDILNAVIDAGGREISTAEIGAAVGMDHTGGHFSNMIGPLGTLGLIERRNGMVKPTEILFPAALA